MFLGEEGDSCRHGLHIHGSGQQSSVDKIFGGGICPIWWKQVLLRLANALKWAECLEKINTIVFVSAPAALLILEDNNTLSEHGRVYKEVSIYFSTNLLLIY